MILRQSEAIKKYKVSKMALKKWMEEGKLSEIKTPGGHRRYLSEELDKLFGIERADDDSGRD